MNTLLNFGIGLLIGGALLFLGSNRLEEDAYFRYGYKGVKLSVFSLFGGTVLCVVAGVLWVVR